MAYQHMNCPHFKSYGSSHSKFSKLFKFICHCLYRLWCLKPCVKTLEALGDVEIIFIDNGSTYPPLLEFLKEEEGKGRKVYREAPIKRTADLYRVINAKVVAWFSTLECEEEPSSIYGVTDPDILLDNPSPRFLETCIQSEI